MELQVSVRGNLTSQCANQASFNHAEPKVAAFDALLALSVLILACLNRTCVLRALFANPLVYERQLFDARLGITAWQGLKQMIQKILLVLQPTVIGSQIPRTMLELVVHETRKTMRGSENHRLVW